LAVNGTALRERHLGELVSQLASETGTLVRLELDLARAEMQERVDAVRSELQETVELARSETADQLGRLRADAGAKARKAGSAAGMFGTAGVGALLSLGALTACFVLLLSRVMPADLAAAVVALAWGLVAAAAALRGRDAMRDAGGLALGSYLPRRAIAAVKADLAQAGNAKQALPEQTIETVKEDVQWVKTRGKSDTR
jgi:putative superfamily III holin-X